MNEPTNEQRLLDGLKHIWALLDENDRGIILRSWMIQSIIDRRRREYESQTHN